MNKRLIFQLLLSSIVSSIFGSYYCEAQFLSATQLRSGMKGYGITAIENNKITKFDVEVLGVLHNALPKQDIIIVRCISPILEKSGIIAGMSGSPIHIGDKLIGALAYGWTFAKEPIAGVTPITDMLKLIQPTELKINKYSPVYKLYSPPMEDMGAFQPLESPLIVGGMGQLARGFLSKKLAAYGLRVLETPGGGSNKNSTHNNIKSQFKPGDGIGIQLIKGDLNATAIGTVTSVRGNQVLAFGHPMFNIGRADFPATTIDIITIISRWNRSFKLGEPKEELGALILDKQSAIVVDTTKKGKMIPVELNLYIKDRKERSYQVAVVDHPILTFILVLSSLLDLIAEGVNDIEEATINIKAIYNISSKTYTGNVTVEDVLFNKYGVNDPFVIFDTPSIEALDFLLDNNFEKAKINKIRFDINIVWENRYSEIIGVKIDKDKVKIGDKVELLVYLRTQENEIKTLKKELYIPPFLKNEENITIEIAGGNSAPLYLPPPQNLSDVIKNWKKRFLSTQLVITFKTKGMGVALKGEILKNIPPFAMYGIVGYNEKIESKLISGYYQEVINTNYVIEGKSSLTIQLEPNINYP